MADSGQHRAEEVKDPAEDYKPEMQDQTNAEEEPVERVEVDVDNPGVHVTTQVEDDDPTSHAGEYVDGKDDN